MDKGRGTDLLRKGGRVNLSQNTFYTFLVSYFPSYKELKGHLPPSLLYDFAKKNYLPSPFTSSPTPQVLRKVQILLVICHNVHIEGQRLWTTPKLVLETFRDREQYGGGMGIFIFAKNRVLKFTSKELNILFQLQLVFPSKCKFFEFLFKFHSLFPTMRS